ncbi:MAG: hypothetical protein WBA76_04045, partial [Phormidesmis sp.]
AKLIALPSFASPHPHPSKITSTMGEIDESALLENPLQFATVQRCIKAYLPSCKELSKTLNYLL